MPKIEEIESPNARLRKFRNNWRISAADMGAHFGVVGSTYQHWEKDGAGISHEARQILNDLGMNLHWLDTGEGEMLRPGVSLDVVVVEGRKQLRKTVTVDISSSGHKIPKVNWKPLLESLPAPEAVATIEVVPLPPIKPSMVAQAAQMVDEVIASMPPEHRPTDEKRWEAYAIVARYLAQDHVEGKEGTARRFLMGLKAEWTEAPAKRGA